MPLIPPNTLDQVLTYFLGIMYVHGNDFLRKKIT